MPLAPDQTETALAILSEMIAGLYRERIALGQMEAQEYRDLLNMAPGEREVSGAIFAGPLRALYRVAPLR